jgi:RimJ/RimL family protein N-acetyltransferase
MLEGNKIKLRAIEPEDIPIVSDWLNNIEYQGQYTPMHQKSKKEWMNHFSNISEDHKEFVIEKKDGTKIGLIIYFMVQGGPYRFLEIGYSITIPERKKGYCTEAVKILIDFLFLSQAIERIQATADSRNIASQKVLEKAGFTKEGTLRKAVFIKGNYIDISLFSMLRDAWKEPKILKI